jgi:hypothetical protein
MDKSLIIKIVVVAIVVLFLLEQFVPGMLRSRTTSSTTTVAITLSGSAEFEATLKSYEPYIVVTSLTAQQIKDTKAMTGVEDVVLTDKGYIISLKNSKYVKDVFGLLKAKNLTMAVIANVYLPSNLEFVFENNSNVSIFTGASMVKVVMEPIVEEGELVRLRMNGQSENGYLVSYSPPMVIASEISFKSEAKVKQKLFDFYSYVIAWENRTQIDENALGKQFGAENVSLTKKDFVLLQTPLSVGELLTKKYEYVSMISENSISVVDGFANTSRILADFGNVTFPDTMVQIKSAEDPAIGFESSKNPVYEITLYGTEYVFSNPDVLIVLDSDYAQNETMNVTVIASAVGNTVLDISDVKLSVSS